MHGTRPNRRNPRDLQIEVCDLCGGLIGHDHLSEPDVEGLRGYKICDSHQFERKAMANPSYLDYKMLNPPPHVPEVARQEPIGGEAWWLDPELEE